MRFYRVCPLYGIEFSREGCYEQLAALLGQTLDEPWPEDMVRHLHTALYQFEQSYEARGGKMLSQTVGDAFLLYLKSYATAGPLDVSSREMDLRVARLWGELVVDAQEEAIDYIAEDELIEVTPKSIRLRKKILDTPTRLKAQAAARRG